MKLLRLEFKSDKMLKGKVTQYIVKKVLPDHE